MKNNFNKNYVIINARKSTRAKQNIRIIMFEPHAMYKTNYLVNQYCRSTEVTIPELLRN